jgi:hypothetical protein
MKGGYKMERLQKVIYLIEENPIVSSFDDIEKILKSIFKPREIKSILTDEVKMSFNLSHGGRNQSYRLVTQESKTYEIATTPTVDYIVKVTGYNLQTSDSYYRVKELIVNGTDLAKCLKQSMKANHII